MERKGEKLRDGHVTQYHEVRRYEFWGISLPGGFEWPFQTASVVPGGEVWVVRNKLFC